MVLLLAGCATPARREPAAGPERFELRGRIGVRYRGDGFSGSLLWRHEGGSDRVELLNPLGTVYARLSRDSSGAMLETSDGKRFEEPDAATLSRSILGWELPLESLRYWAFGEAAPGGEALLEAGPDGRPARLAQQGWEVRYLAWNGARPSLMELAQPGLRVKIAVSSLAAPMP